VSAGVARLAAQLWSTPMRDNQALELGVRPALFAFGIDAGLKV
jgi:hypothetical protein